MSITVDDMVQREVLCCVSGLVSTLARGTTHPLGDDDLPALCEKADELAAPIPDYEEAATQEGWQLLEATDDGCKFVNGPAGSPEYAYTDDNDPKTAWSELCEAFDIEPIEREVFEHWAVSEWFAEKLEAAGEKVDRDFEGLCVWARTCTGQGIASDSVVIAIHADMVAPYVDKADG
mgnify:CR=1 FL=1|jgi:hypothetical protein